MARSHLSIGDVLGVLQTDFPDVTISKIRFLETQGLIDPERTPSGYRKFYDGDVERLRWILTEQRDHFLPLRVIRERLDRGEHLENSGAALADDTAAAATDGGVAGDDVANGRPAGFIPSFEDDAPVLDAGPSVLTLTVEELSSASGLSTDDLAELENFGLLTAKTLGPSTYYDAEALAVANIAARFARFGVEPRHLRMYLVSAEREAGVFEQVVMPLIRQRNPTARREALEQLEEMAQLGSKLRASMVRRALAPNLGS